MATNAISLAGAAAAALLAGCSAVDTASAERFARTGELVALSGGGGGAQSACFTCHGLDGRGDGAGVPRLAGLGVGYLHSQLNAYADGRRAHRRMGWIADRLDPSERHAVSAYYAAMPFDGPDGMPAAAPALYVSGDASRGLPACAACHGLRGQGLGPANPPLAGQPAPYLAHQLEKWRRSERRSDAMGVMQRISRALEPAEIAALAEYAERLPGDPRPALPEGSR